jgi:PST family polysaccharide transporter
MKIPTYIQLTIRVLSLPFLFLFIHTGDDILIYATIFSASNILSALICVLYLYKYEYIKYRFVKLSAIKQYFNDAKPFFWSSSTGVIKEESVNILIGSLFGMRELAFYNLAEKIVKIPRLLTMNINDAIFPKFISENKKNNVSKIIKYEMWIGIAIIALIIIFGKWAVLLLGGNEMLSAYPMAVILSITILVWLIVGSYISFVFIPAKKYYFVTKNQFVALLSFLLFFTIGILITKSIYVIIISITLSGVFEVLYCKYLIKKHKML